MFTINSTTDTLAWIFGLYMLATGIGVMVQRDVFAEILDELKMSRLLTMITGILAYAVGAVTIALHNDWSSWLAVIVTLFGWAALVKGLIYLAYPKIVFSFGEVVLASPKTMTLWGLMAALFGAVLMIGGLV